MVLYADVSSTYFFLNVPCVVYSVCVLCRGCSLALSTVSVSLRSLSSYRTCLASKHVFTRLRCHMIDPFPLTAESLLLLLRKVLRPKIRRSPKHRWPAPQVRAASKSPLVHVPCAVHGSSQVDRNLGLDRVSFGKDFYCI